MFSFFPKERRIRRAQGSQFSSPSTAKERSKPKIVFDDTRRINRDVHDNDASQSESEEDGENGGEQEDEDEDEDSQNDEMTPLLPIFQASHLGLHALPSLVLQLTGADALPVYNLTHAIRLLVVPRCETTLTWDQLRSPQVSQFMIKPIQKNIIASHFSRATIYALLSNCLQFSKEAAESPGNAGTSKTRAMVCELLAIRLLKEYSIRELIDALSYDFYPLQGLSTGETDIVPAPRAWELPKQQARAARVSTLEIAIRAQAKRFLAHPLVVQQLEAIWAGTIVFHSVADSAHRPQAQPVPNHNSGYGTIQWARSKLSKVKNPPVSLPPHTYKTVTIYDPKDASLFKLSRLRVPRYRSFLSTVSLAILLGLFVAVLTQKSIHITALEILFWLWSAGFMLDEVVGLTDQGFNLYLLSFWNAFDIGILFVLVVYYCLRLYGLIIADDNRKWVAYLAYDVLGLNAILLFPRLFSVLDHYRYFSQLLIAFRIMARDLVAVLVLIGISCSGFFVAFTLAFGNESDQPNDVAYTLFQLIMGFTPAAWEKWEGYNRLGQAALVLFMFITHFLVVTILITVLTNSFMAIVQNANDEHQFVFAINTISMVKSDALFSYVAPANILAWILTPLRSCLPFKQYVRLNRTIIKITHFPILFGICAYERLVLQRSVYEPTDLIERRGRARNAEQDGLFTSRTVRARERSAATMFQDKVLDAVFQRPLRRSASHRDEAQKSARPDRVDSWMSQLDTDGPTGPPAEQDRSIVDRLERRRRSSRMPTPKRSGLRNFTTTLSVVSDPEDFLNTGRIPNSVFTPFEDVEWQDESREDLTVQAGNDGDDELITNDGIDNDIFTPDSKSKDVKNPEMRDYFQPIDPMEAKFRQPSTSQSQNTPDSDLVRESQQDTPDGTTLPFSKSLSRLPARASTTRPSSSSTPSKAKQRATHNRTLSTNTILYNPLGHSETSPGSKKIPIIKKQDGKVSTRDFASQEDLARSASPSNKKLSKQRRNLIAKNNSSSTLNIGELLSREPPRNIRGQRSSYGFDIASDLGDNKAPAGGYIAGLPASFGTHMDFMTRASGYDNDEQQRMGKLMLSRMNTLEQGFREVLKEVKDWRRGDASSNAESHRSPVSGTSSPARHIREREIRAGNKALGKKRREGVWIEDNATADHVAKEIENNNAEHKDGSL